MPRVRHQCADVPSLEEAVWRVEREVGQDTGVPVADVYAAWEEREAIEGDMFSHLINGLNHPEPEMHEIPAELIFEIIDEAYRKNDN